MNSVHKIRYYLFMVLYITFLVFYTENWFKETGNESNIDDLLKCSEQSFEHLTQKIDKSNFYKNTRMEQFKQKHKLLKDFMSSPNYIDAQNLIKQLETLNNIYIEDQKNRKEGSDQTVHDFLAKLKRGEDIQQIDSLYALSARYALENKINWPSGSFLLDSASTYAQAAYNYAYKIFAANHLFNCIFDNNIELIANGLTYGGVRAFSKYPGYTDVDLTYYNTKSNKYEVVGNENNLQQVRVYYEIGDLKTIRNIEYIPYSAYPVLSYDKDIKAYMRNNDDLMAKLIDEEYQPIDIKRSDKLYNEKDEEFEVLSAGGRYSFNKFLDDGKYYSDRENKNLKFIVINKER